MKDAPYRNTFYTYASPVAAFLGILFLLPFYAHASQTDGTIDATLKYAWSNNVGWVNFAPTNGNVHVTDSALTGYIWDSRYGSINLAPTHGGVTNNGGGTLGGHAWSTGVGWIDFSGVTIDANGLFHGQATGSGIGILTFDCTHCAVKTDWRPISVRTPATPTPTPSTGGGGGIPSLIGTPAVQANSAVAAQTSQSSAGSAGTNVSASQGVGVGVPAGTQTGGAANAAGANLFDVQLGIASAATSGVWNWEPWALGAVFFCLVLLCFVEARRWYRRRLIQKQILSQPEPLPAQPEGVSGADNDAAVIPPTKRSMIQSTQDTPGKSPP